MKFFVFTFLVSISCGAEPKRIISLSPAITEMIFALGFEKTLVGVSEHSDYPLEAKKIARVGPYSKPLIEKIVALRPDLIFIPSEGPSDITVRLTQLSLKFKVLSIQKISQIADAAIELSKEMGEPEKGRLFKTRWDKKVFETFKEFSPKEENKSLIVLQTEPIIVAAQNTFLDEILNRCGGKNIFSDKTGYPRVPLEAILQKKPKHILLVEHFETKEDKKRAEEYWRKLGLTSVIDPNTATRPGPRILDGAKSICGVFY